MLFPLFKGISYGFLIAAIVGPISLLCLRRALNDGFWAGLTSGLGAATADAIYGVVAAMGLATVTHFLIALQIPLQFFGGAFLIYLGIDAARSQPPPRGEAAPTIKSSARLYLSTLLLTLANPMTILSFIAAFAGLAENDFGRSWTAPAFLVLGVFLGSSVWWIVLCSLAGKFGQNLTPARLRLINVLSGLCITGFGLWQLGKLALRWI